MKLAGIFVVRTTFRTLRSPSITSSCYLCAKIISLFKYETFLFTLSPLICYIYCSSGTFQHSRPIDGRQCCAYRGQISIPATVEIGGTTYKVTAIGDYAFHFANITSLTLPEGLDSLGYKAIYQTQLAEIKVPNSVTIMAYEALGYN